MTPWNTITLVILAVTVTLAETGKSSEPDGAATGHSGALAGHRYRVLVSSDIGGTDPDDFQSMVHLLVYAYVLSRYPSFSSSSGAGVNVHCLPIFRLTSKPRLSKSSRSVRAVW